MNETKQEDPLDIVAAKYQTHLDKIDVQLETLLTSCQLHNICDAEFVTLTQRLVDVCGKRQSSSKSGMVKKTAIGVSLLALVFILAECSLTQDLFLVITRALLVQILSWWDWTYLYYSQCALVNPLFSNKILSENDCNMCEAIDLVEEYANISPDFVSNELLANEIPFLVDDALLDWKLMKSENFFFDNITDVYLSDSLKDTEPCVMTSNLGTNKHHFRDFLSKIHDSDTRQWFAFWENCDKKAAKALRPLYQRPYFMPSAVQLSDSNWVFMSSNFKAKVFKKVDFRTEMLTFVQLRGWSEVRLLPRDPCQSTCLSLRSTIKEGQIMVVTSRLWKLEFIPGANSDNLAIAMGGFWK